MNKIPTILLATAACFGCGFLCGMLQAGALGTWYPALDKSWVTPPDMALTIGWAISYICIGLSLGFVLEKDSEKRAFFIALYAAQLFLQFLWILLFFHFRQPAFGLAACGVLIALILWYKHKAKEVSLFASRIYIPYLIWIIFTGYLNFYIVLKN